MARIFPSHTGCPPSPMAIILFFIDLTQRYKMYSNNAQCIMLLICIYCYVMMGNMMQVSSLSTEGNINNCWLLLSSMYCNTFKDDGKIMK